MSSEREDLAEQAAGTRAGPSTVELSRRASDGDEAAFSELYARHFGRVLRITALRLGSLLGNSPDRIEEAVQYAFSDTFLRIRDGRVPEIHTEHAFRRYVAAAAANRVRSEQRMDDADRRGGGSKITASETLFDLIATAKPGPGTLLDLSQSELRLEAAVLDLPASYRCAIELHCYAGMSAAEIAESGELVSPSGKPVTTSDGVRLIVHRARKMLSAALGIED